MTYICSACTNSSIARIALSNLLEFAGLHGLPNGQTISSTFMSASYTSNC